MACVFCWIFGVWVCVQTDGSRHLATSIVIRVPALSSLGSSFLPHRSARVPRGFVSVDDIPLCAPRPWRWRLKKKKKRQQKKATDHQDFYALHSFLFSYEISFYYDQDSGYDLNASTVN
jgi:hypothetical protein